MVRAGNGEQWINLLGLWWSAFHNQNWHWEGHFWHCGSTFGRLELSLYTRTNISLIYDFRMAVPTTIIYTEFTYLNVHARLTTIAYVKCQFVKGQNLPNTAKAWQPIRWLSVSHQVLPQQATRAGGYYHYLISVTSSTSPQVKTSKQAKKEGEHLQITSELSST